MVWLIIGKIEVYGQFIVRDIVIILGEVKKLYQINLYLFHEIKI